MRPLRNRVRPGLKTPLKTPSSRDHSNEPPKVQDPVEVFCRLRPRSEFHDNTCVSLQSSTTLTLIPPDVLRNKKVVQHTFNHIFTEHANQKEVFEHVALPLLKGLVQGENGLLFTYGVTGSGKTFTMSGEPNNPGITPRCINALFNSISEYQTPKFLIKSDKMNGFEIQSDGEALEERMRDVKMKRKVFKKPYENGSPVTYMNDGTKINNIDPNLRYTIFVSYVEIYNNIAYDLLDDPIGTKTLQAKILREDCNHNIYVNCVVEVEVKSSEEAFELYTMGKKRKRMAQTSMNTESSRSHSIFTIRLVSGPLENNIAINRNMLNVAQLSLVDLAGSERCSRTQTSGQRLKEAGNINNSLMSLRTCLEILRENQQSGVTRIVPYRDSRLTLLFKNFFDGEGKVKMVVCVNPSAKDYDETVHVMKFAEMTQEVKVLRPEIKVSECEEAIQAKILDNKLCPVSVSIQTDEFDIPYRRRVRTVPKVRSLDPNNEEIKTLILYLKRRKQNMVKAKTIHRQRDKLRGRLVNLLEVKSQYDKHVKYLLPVERRKVKDLKNKLIDMEVRYDQSEEVCKRKDAVIEDLQCVVREKDFKIRQNLLDKAKHKRKIEQVSEKMTHQMDAKLRHQREYLTASMKHKMDKIEMVKDILNDRAPPPKHLKLTRVDLPSDENIDPQEPEKEIPEKEHIPRRDAPVVNVRYRRSRSAGDVWLQHRPTNPTPLGTILQPVMKCRKSVNKLTDMKDVVHAKQSKYLLISQNQDDVGDLETKLYKGDIIPTCSGGAQVIFDDVEKLKQESPTQHKLK